jgi:hypothetical protein
MSQSLTNKVLLATGNMYLYNSSETWKLEALKLKKAEERLWLHANWIANYLRHKEIEGIIMTVYGIK